MRAQGNLRASDVEEVLKPSANKGDPEAQMYMAFYLQQKLAIDRGVGEMREERGVGENIRSGTKRGGAKRAQDQVRQMLSALYTCRRLIDLSLIAGAAAADKRGASSPL